MRTEAIQIKLTGVTGWHVLYRVYLQGSGWQEWKKDGETAGTVGESKRMEAIQISLSRNPYLSVTGITLNKSTSKISVGSSETLAAAVTPGYATSQNITWTSSNPSVASVSSGGKVSGVSAGSATIVARTPDGAITAACTYTVAAASSMAISGHTIVPDPLTAGTGVTVKGTVSSAYPISEITAQIRIGTSTGTPVYIVSARPNTTTFNLSQWDDDLLFSKLGPGNYVYFVKARDSQGVLKELYVKSFTVQAANAATSRILDNIKNSPNIPAGEKTDACIETAKIMLENGYEPSFVAGMLANICKEGAAGKFESSNYVSHPEKEPDYLRYMDAHHGYRSKYSGQYIYNNIDVREVYELLKSFDQQDWNIGGSRVGFGLGSVQWTFSRTYTLVQLYLEVNGNQRIISRPQVIQAESLMILRELQGGYQHVYTNWKAANSANLNSQIAAGAAGDTLCYNYEKPKSRATSRYERADLARAIYADMMK